MLSYYYKKQEEQKQLENESEEDDPNKDESESLSDPSGDNLDEKEIITCKDKNNKYLVHKICKNYYQCHCSLNSSEIDLIKKEGTVI